MNEQATALAQPTLKEQVTVEVSSVDWSEYKFHCSALPAIMTNGRSKSELLSETAKAYLREMWIKETFGREKFTGSKYTEKGLLMEQDSLDAATKALRIGFIAKNRDLLSNDFICGTPDAVKPILLDVKSSWDIWTFCSVDEAKANKDYYWQLWGYMWLTGKTEAKLIYTLMNTPSHIVEGELYSLSFKMPEDQVENYRKNYEYDDIPADQRVKIFDLTFREEELDNVQQRLAAAREYMATLTI